MSLIPIPEGGYCESRTHTGEWVLLVSYPYRRVGIMSLIPIPEGGYYESHTHTGGWVL